MEITEPEESETGPHLYLSPRFSFADRRFLSKLSITYLRTYEFPCLNEAQLIPDRSRKDQQGALPSLSFFGHIGKSPPSSPILAPCFSPSLVEAAAAFKRHVTRDTPKISRIIRESLSVPVWIRSSRSYEGLACPFD